MTDFLAALGQARDGGDPDRFVELIPYAVFLGVSFSEDAHGPLFRLAFREHNIGNPTLPALHGGVIGAFMENAAILDLLWRQESTRLPKVVDFSIDFLRPGRPESTWARCDIRRQGKRVANVGVTAWQGVHDAERVIATARTHFLLSAL